jgi:hypothetical protein
MTITDKVAPPGIVKRRGPKGGKPLDEVDGGLVDLRSSAARTSSFAQITIYRLVTNNDDTPYLVTQS